MFAFYIIYLSVLGILLVYMSQYWHSCTFFHFSYATTVEVLKVLFQCFEPKLLSLIRLQALGNFRANSQSLSLLGFGDTKFGVTTFWTTFPLLDENVP